MNITLMAHDKKKELMVQFCTAYKSILSKHSLSATAATGRLVSEATNLPVALFLSKNQGGHQQVDARIAYNEIDLVIMFSDLILGLQRGDLDWRMMIKAKKLH